MEPFEAVVATHGATVLRVCRAVLGPVDAEDAWSETFLAALRAYPDLPTGANVEAWLVTIAHRKAIDHVRARARRAVPTDTLPEPRLTDGEHPGSWQRDLWAALADLPERQRHSLAYHYLAGLTYVEVAAVIGGTPEAARKAGSDGVRALRRTYLEGARR
ncbi:RNA polymerase sigma factor [Georgenia faecalis]|uniref:RNA polymerase sigma factor n=1 Tax=Georgenia faecalis TaxID=2483799 RepID=A0ABV9D973_9MICO|nr:RNA polymerase sigma factor [Georgenia faecalis]